MDEIVLAMLVSTYVTLVQALFEFNNPLPYKSVNYAISKTAIIKPQYGNRVFLVVSGVALHDYCTYFV
jgi:hypothetical protein